jgi:predicted transcriptional regulator
MPTRVIDLAPNGSKLTARLIETNHTLGCYAALSYAWGVKDQPVMTLRSTIESFQRELPVSNLPQTILDALIVTQQLGISIYGLILFVSFKILLKTASARSAK